MAGFKTLGACLAAVLAVVASARADLPTFNRAVQQSDFQAAALAAASTWGTIDRKRPEIAIIAREFAWMAMLANRPVDANTYTTFLVSTPGLNDPTPLTTNVLHAWASLSLNDTPETRAALIAALKAGVAAPGVDLVAVAAANDLAARGDVAAITIVVELRSRRAPLVKQRHSELIAIINAFGEKRDTKPYLTMIQLDQALHNEAMNPAWADIRDELFDLHDQAWAWRVVMESVLRGSRTPYPLADAQHREDIALRYSGAPGAMPPCPGDITMKPEVKFPFRERKESTTGAVIVDMGIDAQGKTVNPRILTAVPPDSGFNDAVLEAARQWTFSALPGVNAGTCTLARDHHAVTVQFGFKGVPQ
jgi:TonB family protein